MQQPNIRSDPAFTFIKRPRLTSYWLAVRTRLYIAAWPHKKQTNDTVGFQSMLALSMISSNSDLAPSWLVSEITQFSKQERERLPKIEDEAVSGGGRVGRRHRASGCQSTTIPHQVSYEIGPVLQSRCCRCHIRRGLLLLVVPVIAAASGIGDVAKSGG
jgi:hypothetical protein